MASTPEPLVSIALCTYNGARYLRTQLDSLLVQTHRNLEIIAVDDGSSDETYSILLEYARRDPRIRSLANQVNVGFRKNFERAISLCSGEFIAPCDQDDVWAPEKLSVLLHAIDQRQLAYCDSALIDEDGRPLNLAMSDMLTMVSTEDPAVFVDANCVSGHASLFRRELAARALPTPPCFFHDWWIAAVAASAGGVVYCDRKLVLYRYHRANVTDVRAERTVRRERGYRWKELHDFRERLEHLAMLPGENKLFLARLRDLWVAREQQWTSFALALFMWRNRARLFAIRKTERPSPRRMLRYAPGLRLKRLTRPFAYASPP